MKIVLGIIIIAASLTQASTAIAAPAMAVPAAAATAGCPASQYDFPNAYINSGGLAGSGPVGLLVKDVRRTLAILGQRAFKAGCSIQIICVSRDNSKPVFEADKVYCKTARDAVVATRPDKSAAKATVVTTPKRPKDGYSPGSIHLVVK